MNDLNSFKFYNETFIPLEKSFSYLESNDAVYELDTIYWYYKGFANEMKTNAGSFQGRPPGKVHIDGMVKISDNMLGDFWDAHFNNGNLGVSIVFKLWLY